MKKKFSGIISLCSQTQSQTQPNTVYRTEFPDNEDDQKHGTIIFVAVKRYFYI